MRRRPFYQQTEWRIIAGLGIIAVILTVWHHRARAAGGVSLPDRAAWSVMMPIQHGFRAGWEELSLTTTGLLRSRQLAKENRRLAEQCARLDAKIIQRQNQYLDYRDMRATLGFGLEDAPEGIRAQVVGQSGSRLVRQTIDIVAAGGREVRKGDIVCTYDGLVGRVQAAYGSRARVMTLLDPDMGAAAVARPSNAVGAILGPDPASPDPDLLRLVRLDPNAHIAQGEKVFTSAIGETYPKDIPIGEVEEVVRGTGPGQSKSALVRPYVKFENLSYAIVTRPQG